MLLKGYVDCKNKCLADLDNWCEPERAPHWRVVDCTHDVCMIVCTMYTYCKYIIAKFKHFTTPLHNCKCGLWMGDSERACIQRVARTAAWETKKYRRERECEWRVLEQSKGTTLDAWTEDTIIL